MIIYTRPTERVYNQYDVANIRSVIRRLIKMERTVPPDVYKIEAHRAYQYIGWLLLKYKPNCIVEYY
jgi:hypothetical protein